MVERSGGSPFVRVAIDGPVAEVVLNRPHRHNALVPELLDDLRSAVSALAADESVRVLVISAEGRSFSTGGDVAAFAAQDAEDLVTYARRIVGGLHDTILDLLTLRVPVIAAVHGAVTGGSLGLVLAAELLNTAVEMLFRGLPQAERDRVYPCLDVAAGGVLAASVCAAVAGLLILLPRFRSVVGG